MAPGLRACGIVGGRRLVCIRSRAVSNKMIEKIYAVNDIVETVVDPATGLPVRFTKNLSEGPHRYHEITTFDHASRVVNLSRLEAESLPIASFSLSQPRVA